MPKSNDRRPKRQRRVSRFTDIEWRDRTCTVRKGVVIVQLETQDLEQTAIDERVAKFLSDHVSGGKLLRHRPGSGLLRLGIPEKEKVREWALRLAEVPGVAYVEPAFQIVGDTTVGSTDPGDERRGEQWGLDMIAIEAAWSVSMGSSDVAIAVMDTGIEMDATGTIDHEDLDDERFILAEDFYPSDYIDGDDATDLGYVDVAFRDGHGHGTHVAGIIAATTNNGPGISGINWHSDIYVYRILDAYKAGDSDDLAYAIIDFAERVAAAGVKGVVNLSLHVNNPTDVQIERLDEAAAKAESDDVLLVCSGGEGTTIPYPAYYATPKENVMAVASIDAAKTVVTYAGGEISVAAPGEDILSTYPNYKTIDYGTGGYDYLNRSGPSQAVPHVAGLAALVWGMNTDLTAPMVRQVMLDTVEALAGMTFGLINAKNALEAVSLATMAVLDRSGSMNSASGVTGMRRVDVLTDAIDILISSIPPGHHLGVVSFNEEPHDVHDLTLIDFDDPDAARDVVKGAVEGFAGTIGGLTAIGDGLERAHLRLSEQAGVYNPRTIIVMTDGHETTAKYIADVAGLIDERTFAIGLGTADEVQPGALDELTNNKEGYLLMTDSLDDDNANKLAKYYDQIYAGVLNDEIVLDPTDHIAAGDIHRIPFPLTTADYRAQVTLIGPRRRVLHLELEAPDGRIIRAGDDVPMMTHTARTRARYFRFTLPVNLDGYPHAGQWHARIIAPSGATGSNLYSVMVRVSTELRMKCTARQTSRERGNVTLTAEITQRRQHITGATVHAHALDPLGATSIMPLTEVMEGVYETEVFVQGPGVYTYLIVAIGLTLAGDKFKREQVRTAALWAGGDSPPPTS